MSRRKTTEEFIEEAHKIHGDKYDYSKVEYVNYMHKICIICPTHGEFWQRPSNHLQGKGCEICGGRVKKTTEQFIEEARKVHGDKYDYSKVDYINNHTKVCIICPIHGEFWQTPNCHLRGKRCCYCYGNIKKTKEEFIEQSKQIHGNKYDYSKVEYINNNVKVCIICPIHGEFWQTPSKHLNAKHGCPLCKESNLEQCIKEFLLSNNIEYYYQYRFKWLGKQSLDFYLPKYNVAIECQGRQHFEPISCFGGEEGFNEIIERDIRKKKLCNENGINIIYYTNDERIKDTNIIKDFDKLLKEIKNE